ncbi:MAG: hypothetical protein JOZ52_08630 [Acidobacteria bacterium]|nr:hypothetical protein [Acidobacteriota bacterium]
MGRRKRSSRILTQATERLSGIKSIDPSLDLGNGLKAGDYEAAINNLRTAVDDYNLSLSQLDEKANRIDAAEEVVRDWSERMLAGVASKYSKNSDEYEKAGGVRKDERKRPARTPVATKA